MTNLFRKNRRDTINKNQPTEQSRRYLKYAIGEILLVVIGILIALQINNWNETRKISQFEQEIMALINQNLEKDSIALTKVLFEAKQANSLIDSLLAQVAVKNYSEKLNKWMGKIICFERFKSQSSAFEVLKAKGIESVRNNQIQLDLMSYYDERVYRLYESFSDVEFSFKTDWLPIVKTQFLDFKWQTYCVPLDSKRFFEDPSTIVLFKIYQDNRAGVINRMEATLEKISQIRKQIKVVYK